ncbi:endonuclease domain-containing protein [Leifsonia sp. EB34]|uniref:endonuclease domain-containing protein n=1 Tax=Leifsonia sp. EB34 TaxID=3156303 RepID=UPI003514ED5B
MTWMNVLAGLGGIATSNQLVAGGVTARELTAAVRGGRLLRPRRGVYALPSAPPLAIAAVANGGRLSCVSAARSYGLWGGVDGRTHLRVPSHATRLPDGDCVRHWVDGDPHPECWRVSVPDCLRSAARCATEETAVAVLDTAVSAGLVTLTGVERIFSDQPPWMRAIASRARPGSDSGIESLVRQRLESRGHVVEQQIHVAGVGRVDMRIDGVLYLELDGFAYHSGREAFERDRARDTGLALAGGRRLRVSARQVLEEWEAVLGVVEGVLVVPEKRGVVALK